MCLIVYSKDLELEKILKNAAAPLRDLSQQERALITEGPDAAEWTCVSKHPSIKNENATI